MLSKIGRYIIKDLGEAKNLAGEAAASPAASLVRTLMS